MVGKTERILLELPALLSERTEQRGTLYNPKCMCFLAEENICESCLSPILPSGKMVAGGGGNPQIRVNDEWS